MTGLEIMAVVGAVAAVVSAYNDGSELVKKVRERRRTRRALENVALQDTSTQDLEESLNTSQALVRMKYDNSYRRLGETFANGDRESWALDDIAYERALLIYVNTEEALNTLKDIIIHLQSQVIGNLKVAWQHDDSNIDFIPLQDVSDDSQSRTILCLMQLHQRLLVAAPITEMRPSPPLPPQNVFHGFIEPGSRQQTGFSQAPLPLFSPFTLSRSSTATTEVQNPRPSRFPFGRKTKTMIENPQPQIMSASPTRPYGLPSAPTLKDELVDSTLLAGLGLGLSPTDKTSLNVSRVSSVSTRSSFSLEPDHQESNPYFDPWKDTSSPASHRGSQSSKHSPSFAFGPDAVPEHTSSLGNRISPHAGQTWAPPPQQSSTLSPSFSFGPDSIPEHSSFLVNRKAQPFAQSWAPLQAQDSSSSKRSSRASDNSLQLYPVQSSPSKHRPSISSLFAPQGTPIAQEVIKPRTTGSFRGYLPAEENDFAGFCNGTGPFPSHGRNVVTATDMHSRRLEAADWREEESVRGDQASELDI